MPQSRPYGSSNRPLGQQSTHMSMPSMDQMTWRSPSNENLLNQAQVQRKLARSNTMDAAELGSIEQHRLYQELPFMVLPGMRTSSIKRTRSVNQFKKISSRQNLRAMGSVQGEADPLLDDSAQQDMDMEGAIEIDNPHFTIPLVRSSVIALLTSFVFGYNSGVVNAAEAVVFPDKTLNQWSLAVSIFAVGGPFGAYAGGIAADKFGRKLALLGNAAFAFASGLIMAFAPNIIVIVAGRFLIGVTCGVGTVLVQLYLSELAPPNLRGSLGTCNQFAMVIGILASNILGFPLATPDRWRLLLGATCIPAALQLLCAAFLYESPRWYLMKIVKDAAFKEQNTEYRRLATENLRKLRAEENVDDEIQSMLMASSADSQSSGFLFVLGDASMRLPLLIAVGLQMAQQLSGINAIFYYSNTFFAGMHFANPLLGTTIVGIVNVVATGCAIPLMDTAGRRPLLLFGAAGMLLSLMVVTAALNTTFAASNLVALAAVNSYVFFFELGLGPIPWLIVAEMFPVDSRATAVAIATAVNWACNFIVAQAYPSLNEALGSWSMVPFIAVLSVVIIFTFLYVKETKGKSLEEIQEEMKKAA